MKLHYIYILLGIATLALNLALTVHLFRSRKGLSCSQALVGNEVITFRLAKGHDAEGATTAAVPYDETLPMEEDL